MRLFAGANPKSDAQTSCTDAKVPSSPPVPITSTTQPPATHTMAADTSKTDGPTAAGPDATSSTSDGAMADGAVKESALGQRAVKANRGLLKVTVKKIATAIEVMNAANEVAGMVPVVGPQLKACLGAITKILGMIEKYRGIIPALESAVTKATTILDILTTQGYIIRGERCAANKLTGEVCNAVHTLTEYCQDVIDSLQPLLAVKKPLKSQFLTAAAEIKALEAKMDTLVGHTLLEWGQRHAVQLCKLQDLMLETKGLMELNFDTIKKMIAQSLDESQYRTEKLLKEKFDAHCGHERRTGAEVRRLSRDIELGSKMGANAPVSAESRDALQVYRVDLGDYEWFQTGAWLNDLKDQRKKAVQEEIVARLTTEVAMDWCNANGHSIYRLGDTVVINETETHAETGRVEGRVTPPEMVNAHSQEERTPALEM